MHESTRDLLEYFDYRHLDADLAAYSFPFSELAHRIANELEGPEVTVGIRKLLEAKDCIVRAALTQRKRERDEHHSTS
jgi:hypothetical protein